MASAIKSPRNYEVTFCTAHGRTETWSLVSTSKSAALLAATELLPKACCITAVQTQGMWS